MRTALLDLLVIVPGAQHPVKSNRQFVRDGHFGHSVVLLHRQAHVLPMPAGIVALGDGRRFGLQPAHQPVALFADVSQVSFARAGGHLRNQAKIAGYLLATREPLPRRLSALRVSTGGHWLMPQRSLPVPSIRNNDSKSRYKRTYNRRWESRKSRLAAHLRAMRFLFIFGSAIRVPFRWLCNGPKNQSWSKRPRGPASERTMQ